MIGWAADSSQINNTIRYSNPGIRDIQHGAAFLFTDLVLFDAKYYKSTDAAAFYDELGRHRRRHRLVSDPGEPELSPADRLHRDDEPQADSGDGQGDRGDADVSGVEPVAARGCRRS